MTGVTYVSGAERSAVVTALTQHLSLRTVRQDSATNHLHIDYADSLPALLLFHILIFKTEQNGWRHCF